MSWHEEISEAPFPSAKFQGLHFYKAIMNNGPALIRRVYFSESCMLLINTYIIVCIYM
jgi:hypothetical protein